MLSCLHFMQWVWCQNKVLNSFQLHNWFCGHFWCLSFVHGIAIIVHPLWKYVSCNMARTFILSAIYHWDQTSPSACLQIRICSQALVYLFPPEISTSVYNVWTSTFHLIAVNVPCKYKVSLLSLFLHSGSFIYSSFITSLHHAFWVVFLLSICIKYLYHYLKWQINTFWTMCLQYELNCSGFPLLGVHIASRSLSSCLPYG